jgi:hypothetical protein
MATPKPKPMPKRTEEQKLQDTLKQNQKRISPEGVAAADAAAKKALEERYPNLFATLPKTRNNTRINRGD